MSLFQRLTRFNGKTFRFRLFQVYERKKEPHFWHTGWKMSCISRIDMRYFIRKFQREISACAKSKFAFYWFRVLFCLLKYRSVLLQKSNVFCFFFLENRSWSLSTIGVFSDFLQPGLCAFLMCKARLIKNIRPYFIAFVPSTFSDLSAPQVLW